MASSRAAGLSSSARGNFVSEWFGHRVYPTVAKAAGGIEDQLAKRCAFLTSALRDDRVCIKPPSASGICTISSTSNGPRQDWLVCPYRALDPGLLESVVRRLYKVDASRQLFVTPAPTLARDEVRNELTKLVASGNAAFTYLQDKLGGEISISATERSPELAFDITIVEIVGKSGNLVPGRYGILEVQTMDFHGSYRRAVNNLEDALRLHGADFHSVLESNQGWLSDHVEGPNIANVFKRTFYQTIMKFQIGTEETCAGCVLAIPLAVWDSWQRHLGRPELRANPDGTFALEHPTGAGVAGRVPAWIVVFDIDSGNQRSPNPIAITKVIGTDADSVSYYALKVAPEAAIAPGGSVDRLQMAIRRRLSTWWPDLVMS